MTEVKTHFEEQPHGGALKRSEAVDDFPLATAQDYQDARMATVPALYKTKHEMLACELALGMEEAEVIFARYGHTPEQGSALLDVPAFSALLARISKEIAENGLSFKTKIRAIAEDLLPHAHAIATDPLASTAERVKLIQWAAKLSGHEPKETKDEGRGGGGLNLSITFAGQAPMKVVQNEAITLEG